MEPSSSLASVADNSGPHSLVGPSHGARTVQSELLSIPPARGLDSFYPQSLWYDQLHGGSDTDRLTSQTTYRLKPSEELEVGKYVPDPDLKDFANPKYRPPAHVKARGGSPHGVRGMMGKLWDDGERFSESDTTTEDSPPQCPPLPRESRRSQSTAKVTYPVVVPRYPTSAASLFAPIHYGKPSAKERTDPRGLPHEINEELHPKDRADVPLSSISVQHKNLNRLCLYKIGPMAVAFKVVLNAFEAAGMQYTPSNRDFNILWAKRATPYTLASLNPYQRVNHFPGTSGIGRKDNLAQNTAKMRRLYGADVYDIVPASFLIPSQVNELRADAACDPGTPERPLIYIVKPSASSCGQGIHLYKGVPPMPPNNKQMVCQRYIGNPMLIFGRKFDLRVYCVVTSFDPLRIYLFDEGLVRFAAEKYPGADQDLSNIHVHLTNYSVNKTAVLNRKSRGKDFDSDDPIDIKWCLSDFKAHLIRTRSDGVEAWNTIQREFEDVVTKTFLSIEHDVVRQVREQCRDPSGRNCFELYGLDLMTDDSLKVRLIEVNIMPSLATGTSLDKAVKARMIAHMLTLIRAIPFNRQLTAAHMSGDAAHFVPRGSTTTADSPVYKFGRHPCATTDMVERPLLQHFNDQAVPDSTLSVEETQMLVEAEEELRCAGGFRRIFPLASNVSRYLPLYTHGVTRNTYVLASAVCMANDKKTR